MHIIFLHSLSCFLSFEFHFSRWISGSSYSRQAFVCFERFITTLFAHRKENQRLENLTRLVVKVTPLKLDRNRRVAPTWCTFAEKMTLQKIFCTVISYGAGFQLFPDRLRTDSLGTHIVEQKIGQARQGMDNRWSRILSNISQSLLRSIILSSEGLQIGSSGRLKACGCCLDDSADMTISDFDPVLLSRVMWHSLSEPGRATDCFAPSFERVARWLTIIGQTLEKRGSEIGKIWAPNPTTNSGILSRLINSNLPAYPAHRDQ